MAELTAGVGAAVGGGLAANAMLSLHNGRLVLKLKASAMAGPGASGEFSFAVSYQGMVELINIYRRELHRNHGRPLDWIDPAAADLISKINVLSAVGLDAELLLGMTMWVAHRPVMQVDMIMTLYESLLSRPGRAGGIAESIMTYRDDAQLKKWCVEAVPAALGPLLLTLISEPLSLDAVFDSSEDAKPRRQAKLNQQNAIVRILEWIVVHARHNNSLPAAQRQFEEACMRMNQFGVLSEDTGQTYCENRLKLDLFMESGSKDEARLGGSQVKRDYKRSITFLGTQADLSCRRRDSVLPLGSPSVRYEPQ